jgi:hypothetical protein
MQKMTEKKDAVPIMFWAGCQSGLDEQNSAIISGCEMI